MSFVFHPEAEAELAEAAAWYEERQSGLARDFLVEVRGTIGRIVRQPKVWPVLEGGIRRALVHRFPYGVLYGLDEDRVLVVAIMHLRRRPGYWHDRLDRQF